VIRAAGSPLSLVKSVPDSPADEPLGEEASVEPSEAPGLESAPCGGAQVDRVVARSGHTLVFLRVDEVLAFEARDRLCFVHSGRGCFDVDMSLNHFERVFPDVFLRVHRRWLVAVDKVRSLEARAGESSLTIAPTGAGENAVLRVPVSGDLMVAVRRRLLAGAIGLRQRRRGAGDVDEPEPGNR
jgi:DNA-binding LytR/AlgR family response regulator